MTRAAVRPSRIAVVEDDLRSREALCALLADEGYQVISAADGRKALELLTETEVDLMVTDVAMPRMTGFALVRALRALPTFGDAPVLFVSALDDSRRRVAGLELGADFMSKPVDPGELLAWISEHQPGADRDERADRPRSMSPATAAAPTRLGAVGSDSELLARTPGRASSPRQRR